MANRMLATLLVNAAVFSALFPLLLLARRLLGKRLSPAAMLVLWAVLSVKLIIPFGFESRISLFPAQPAAGQTARTVPPGAGALSAAQMQQLSGGAQKGKTTAQPAPVASAAPAAVNLTATEPSATQSAASTLLVDWPLLLLGLWAAGALAVCAALLAGAANLRRRVRHARTDAPAHVLRAFEEFRRSLGVRRAVGLAVSDAPGVPVVMGAVRPTLVLPEDVCRLDKQSLRHVLTHELMHVRRGDLWALRLMNVLCAVYWFAPTIWLCGRLVRADIETACDHGVLRVLDGSERLAYVATILRFAGKPAVRHLAAAMGMSDGRPAMEKRIAGMYRSARTDWKGRFAAAAVAVLLVSASLLTACQPSPTGQYVKNKKDDSFLNELITPGSTAGNGGSTASGATVAPEDSIFKDYAKNWKATIAAKPHPITVAIDADVITPVAASLPVYTVEPVKLAQEQIDGFLSQFGDVRYHLDMSDIKTKSYYQEALLQAEALLAKLPSNKEYTDAQRKQQQKELESGIKFMQQAMQSAPDETDDVIEPKLTNKYIIMRDSTSEPTVDDNGNLATPAPGSKTAKDEYESTHTEAIDVKWAYNGASMALHAVHSDRLFNNSLCFSAVRGSATVSGSMSPAEALSAASASTNVTVNAADLKGLKTTFAQAKALAEGAVAKFGIDYMTIAQSAKEIKYADLRNAVNHKDTSYFTNFSKLDYTDVDYVFYFTRSIAGVNETYCSNGIQYNSQYDEPWPYERLRVIVDDSGVKQISWESSGSKLGHQLASDSKLLPFDQIQKIAEQQLLDGNIRIDGYSDEKEASAFYKSLVKMEVNIDRVVLGYARVKLNDSSGGYALVPAWDFYGSDMYYQKYDDGTANDTNIDYSMEHDGAESYGHSFLTINAIDGSVIDRSQGY